ncbi:MAG: diaminopimelate epimerase, partial [Balneolaceae bacterium]|nr:diaminopimelate epimerase [Balneolaceae bacterium]
GFNMEELIQLAPMVSNRKFGVGADGLIVLAEPNIDDGTTDLDYTMIYRNADGSDAGMCGNGARCIALYARQRGYGKVQNFNVHEREYRARIVGENEVEIEFSLTAGIEEHTVNGHDLLVVNPGTEHVVEKVDREVLENESYLRDTGRYLREHSHFQPIGTNVNFFCGTDSDELLLQTYERGVEDLTLACGTGAIASALAWHHMQDSAGTGDGDTHRCHVQVKGGTLTVEFAYDAAAERYSDIKLKGPAHFVFEGKINL